MHGAGGTHDAVRGAIADGRTTVGSTQDCPPAPALAPETKFRSLEEIPDWCWDSGW